MIELDLIQTMGLAVLLLLLGKFLVSKISLLERYCIPAPVIGGLIFAILAFLLRHYNILTFKMDNSLQNIVMTIFFTSIGFSASLSLLQKGGIKVFIFLASAIALVILQNILGIALAKLFDLDPLIGLVTGSISMTGGHSTSASFGPLLEKTYNINSANAVAVASATFGLVASGMLGGPVGKRLIEKNNLSSQDAEIIQDTRLIKEEYRPLKEDNFYSATFIIIIAMALGTLITLFFNRIDLTFPPYIGSMLIAAIFRNLSDSSDRFTIPLQEINILGGIGLEIFLSMALMSLRLWDLSDLAIPMIVMLFSQVLLMYLFATLITFKIMGSNYDAAILAGGHCGFGLGAVSNGIANMDSITGRFGPSPTAFFVLPIVGSLFIDFFNGFIITIFINIFA